MLDAGCWMLGAGCANAKKVRVRACAKKSLESATECGKVDAGRAAPRKSSVVRFTGFVSLMAKTKEFEM